MKAIVSEKYGGPEVFKLKEVEKPVPKENEVLVKVHSVSINPFEWHHMRGRPLFMRMTSGMTAPKNKILGMDVSGVVEAVGENVNRFSKGDEVFGYSDFGGLAEYTCISQDLTVHKPSVITFAEAAAIPIAGITALNSLRNVVQIKPGEKVLINGASGGVGTFAVQIAKSMGAEVTGVCSRRNVDLVRSLGADRVIDYTKEGVMEAGQLYDVVIDNVGNLSIRNLKSLRKPGGTCIVVGFTSMRRLLPVMMKGKATKGKIGILSVKPSLEDLIYLKDLMESGRLKPAIDQYYSLEETASAMDYLEEGHARAKVIINVANDVI